MLDNNCYRLFWVTHTDASQSARVCCLCWSSDFHRIGPAGTYTISINCSKMAILDLVTDSKCSALPMLPFIPMLAVPSLLRPVSALSMVSKSLTDYLSRPVKLVQVMCHSHDSDALKSLSGM